MGDCRQGGLTLTPEFVVDVEAPVLEEPRLLADDQPTMATSEAGLFYTEGLAVRQRC